MRYHGLDQLRAASVFAVLVHHFFDPWRAYGNLGSLGVQLFFVISGFLITGILIDSREAPLGRYLKTFYFRRALRIVPSYYLAVLVGALIGEPSTAAYLDAHLAYATNYAIFRGGDWIGPSTHFWSLAVEQQFYLVCPWVIHATPLRALPFCFLGIGLAAPLWRLGLSYWVDPHPQIHLDT